MEHIESDLNLDLGIKTSDVCPTASFVDCFLLNVTFLFILRVSYLKTKKFSQESVAAMVSKAPYLLNFSVERLDNRLGFFQQHLGLSAEKVKLNCIYFVSFFNNEIEFT